MLTTHAGDRFEVLRASHLDFEALEIHHGGSFRMGMASPQALLVHDALRSKNGRCFNCCKWSGTMMGIESRYGFSLSDWRKPITDETRMFFKAQLCKLLKDAVNIELSTIPLYLYSIYSLDLQDDKEGNAAEARTKLLTVVQQEMLHLSLAGNLLTSIASGPKLYALDMVPTYGHKEDTILHSHIPLVLEQCKKDSLERFLMIEAPYDPPVVLSVEEELSDLRPKPKVGLTKSTIGLDAGTERVPNYNSIGEFYRDLEEMLRASYIYLKEPAFRNLDKQFSPAEFFGSDTDLMVQIVDQETAFKALKIIVDQGEGSMTADIAHYQMFLDLYRNRKLWKCLPVLRSPKEEMYSSLPFIKNLSRTFNASYCYLLAIIEKCWRTNDAVIRRGLITNMHVVMVDIMTPLADILVRQPVSNTENAAPTFEFYEVTGEGIVAGDTDSEARGLYVEMVSNIKDAITTSGGKSEQQLGRISFGIGRVAWPNSV